MLADRGSQDSFLPIFGGRMVKATKGMLVYCDAAVREILLKMDLAMHFIIEDLDPNHLFIDEAQIDRISKELERRLSENVYLPPDTVK